MSQLTDVINKFEQVTRQLDDQIREAHVAAKDLRAAMPKATDG
jgi:hypothetical protein